MNTPAPSAKKLHPRNRHHGLYDFESLQKAVPELTPYVHPNPNGVSTIDFKQPKAVYLLNQALLKTHYRLVYWEMPASNLCPPIPGRADYVHYLADLLAESNNAEIPTGPSTKILDIGTGANLIYPIIGHAEYGWQFVASEVNPDSIETAKPLIQHNPHLRANVKLRWQRNKRQVLKNIIEEKEYYHAVMCNPPFYKSMEEARGKNQLKWKKLGQTGETIVGRNFSGQANELWTEGGELTFVTNYCYESKHFAKQVGWFTTLISNKAHVAPLQKILTKLGVAEVQIIPMEQGQKSSRIVAWRY